MKKKEIQYKLTSINSANKVIQIIQLKTEDFKNDQVHWLLKKEHGEKAVIFCKTDNGEIETGYNTIPISLSTLSSIPDGEWTKLRLFL